MLYLIRKYAGLPLTNRSRRLARSFLQQTYQAGDVQRKLLLDRIARHADSQFGRDHHFAEIRTPDDFRRRVPVRGYSEHEPYIERVRRGETNALFGRGTDVLMFAMTSGTTNSPKTIPITRESLDDYRAGWLIWGILAFDAHPGMLDRGMMPILQLASDWRERQTEAGIPCGAITGLTQHMQNPLIRMTYCMPAAGSRIKDVEAKYYVALRNSVHRDLGTIIAANPSTILAIARLGDREKETLIRDLHDGTIDPKWAIGADVREAIRRQTSRPRRRAAKRLSAIVERTGRLLPRDYWPNLQFIANWTGGTMGTNLRNYPEFFGDKPVRDVGLIASEGRFTIPIEDGTPAGILDIQHNYFEFIPEDQGDAESPETVEATELIEGRRYFILPTTSGGLYRYHIHDLVECVGFHGQAPVLVFLNKGAHFSSLTGEKLSEFHVVAAVNAAQKALDLKLSSFLLLPVWGDPPHYELLVEANEVGREGVAEKLARVLDVELGRMNLEYENRRETLRLDPIRIRRLPAGSWGDFQQRRLARSGGTVEQYKQPCLLSDLEAIHGFTFCDEPEGSTR